MSRCNVVQFDLCVLQYTSFFVDGYLSICPSDPCLFLTLGAIQRKKHQRSILVDLCARVRPTDRTFDPLRPSFFLFLLHLEGSGVTSHLCHLLVVFVLMQSEPWFPFCKIGIVLLVSYGGYDERVIYI